MGRGARGGERDPDSTVGEPGPSRGCGLAGDLGVVTASPGSSLALALGSRVGVCECSSRAAAADQPATYLMVPAQGSGLWALGYGLDPNLEPEKRSLLYREGRI